MKDIAVLNGKIVEASKLSTKAKIIDAKGKIVMAGGIDPHTHVAGPKLNVGRLYRPEDKLHDPQPSYAYGLTAVLAEDSPFRVRSRRRTGTPSWATPT